MRMAVLDVSPSTGQLVISVQTKGRNGYGDPAGFVVLNPNNPAAYNWSWLLKDTTTKDGLEGVNSPQLSPDGTAVAFPASQTSKGKGVATGLYRIPITGGAVSTIREESATSTGFGGLRRWTW